MVGKKKAGKIVYRTVLIITSCVFLVSAFMVVKYFYDARQSAKQFEKLQEMVVPPPVEEKPAGESQAPAPPSPAQQYGALYEQNNDFVGWIFIDGTVINYPVMQTVDAPNYYLRRGFDKTYDYYGTPYVAEHCNLYTSDNVVIYGHHMDNGTMFSQLKKYLYKDFWTQHPTFRFDTMEAYGTYEVFAVFKIAATDSFAYHLFSDAANPAEFDAYVAACKQYARYDTGVTPVYGERLLTLSTCEYSQNDGRLVVVARKIA